MQQEQFEIIENNLKDRIKRCSEKLDHIITTDDLRNITIKEFIDLKSFCKQEQIDMTEILMVDLYHVLGMGKLTVNQRNIFLSLLNKYSTYRSDMKCICQMEDIEKLPNLPSKSRYKLHKLGEITLESEPRGKGSGEVHDETSECSVDTYHKAKEDDVALAVTCNTIKLQGNILTFNVIDITKIMPVISPSSTAPGKKDNLLKACNNKTAYCDIVWEYTNEEHTEVKGIILNASKRDSVKGRLRNV